MFSGNICIQTFLNCSTLKFCGYLAQILQISDIILRFDVALQTSFKFRIVQKINKCIIRQFYPFHSNYCELQQINLEWCFRRHHVTENRFRNQKFCARKLYINSATIEQQKRKSFRTAMNSRSTWFQIKLQESTQEQRMSERGTV